MPPDGNTDGDCCHFPFPGSVLPRMMSPLKEVPLDTPGPFSSHAKAWVRVSASLGCKMLIERLILYHYRVHFLTRPFSSSKNVIFTFTKRLRKACMSWHGKMSAVHRQRNPSPGWDTNLWERWCGQCRAHTLDGSAHVHVRITASWSRDLRRSYFHRSFLSLELLPVPDLMPQCSFICKITDG